MSPGYPAVSGAMARLLALSALAVLMAGCGADTHPVGPDDRTYAPALAVGPAAPQATNIEFGDFALHIPANVHHVRGILVALGGPDTRGFAIGTPFGAPRPEVEAALQDLGVRFRDLAADRGLAILGSGRFGPWAYPNDPASDQALLDAVAQAATLTGHGELPDAPLLLYGVSGGGPQAAGFTQRNPERVIGLFLKVPASAGPLTGPALAVPAYMVLAEFDAFVDNAMLTETFETHRAAGAPWALALERGVPHHSLTPAQRQLTVDWMRAILPLGAASPIRLPWAEMGWLGDPVSGEIGPMENFGGDPDEASWFPRRPVAQAWARFIGF